MACLSIGTGSKLKVENHAVVVLGEAAAAYLPELGLKKFERDFVYRVGEGFTITDEVDTTKPSTLTWLLHADDKIEKVGGDRFSIKVREVRLLIDPRIEQPDTLKLENRIETNTVTAPGPPGAVDKGARQARGQKLLLSTSASTKVRASNN